MNANRHIKVLMYHRIIKEKPADKRDFYAVYEHNFRRQLYLLNLLNFTPITFEDYNLYLKGKLSLPQKPIILTFDDGYLEMVKIALPALQRFNMKAVVFVLGNRSLSYPEWNKDKYKEAQKRRLLSDEQIVELRTKGFEIGAHGMSHLNLTGLNNEQTRQEVYGSKHSIETLLNEEILSFAYPFGEVNKNLENLVAQCGFQFGCGAYTGPPKFGDNLYDIRRLAINIHTTTFQFLLKILTYYEYAEWLYGKITNKKNSNSPHTARRMLFRKYLFSPIAKLKSYIL